MAESKIEFINRVRREKRWPEVNAFLDSTIVDETKKLKDAGLKANRSKVADESWKRTMAAFPPLRPGAKSTPSVVEVASPVSGESAEGTSPGDVELSPLPAAWGELAETAPFDVEVEWVHQNRVLVVEERDSAKSLLHWERARKPAPSYGAVNLMEFAATNRKGFMDIVKSVKPGSGSDEENVRREKTSIEEIRKILEELENSDG